MYDEDVHATITGGYAFLGFGWASCGIREVDGESLKFPFPYGVKIAPGKHQIEIWCGGFFVSKGFGYNKTIEFEAIAGHTYDWRMSTSTLVDETTGEVVEVLDVDAKRKREHMIKNLGPALSDPQSLLLAGAAIWFQAPDSQFSFQKGKKGYFGVTNEGVTFVEPGHAAASFSAQFEDILRSKPSGNGVRLELRDGRKHEFTFMKNNFSRYDHHTAQDVFNLLRDRLP
jgi:uncharacterized ubiquitin-like protein YukD